MPRRWGQTEQTANVIGIKYVALNNTEAVSDGSLPRQRKRLMVTHTSSKLVAQPKVTEGITPGSRSFLDIF